MKFEGIVNGEKFTDREQYNARIAELAAAGESINASSTTTTSSMDTCSGCGERCGSCTCNQEAEEDCMYNPPQEAKPQEEAGAVFTLPYVNDDMTVAEDEILEAADASDVEKKLRALVPNNIRAIEQMNLATRSKLLDDLEQIEKNLDEYESGIAKKANQLAQEYLKVCALRVQADEVFPELRGFIRAMSMCAEGGIDEADQAEEAFEKKPEADNDFKAADGLFKLLKSLLS